MKLLIVDDEIRAVQALVKRVNWQEYDFEPPLAAYSMAQAQGVFQQQEIYLMLCDIEMPQGSGLELFEWVKTYYPLTECIFVTCHDEYSYLRSAEQPKDSLLPANTLNVSNPYIRQLLHVLSERLTENLPIPELADSMHLNPQYIMRLFKKEMGCSILQYITSRRIALAVQYLEDTNLPITEVALLCGFDNYSYFTRVFKRFTGQSPAAFRKRSVPPD